MNIQLFRMGFGESILLSEDSECLLVDCGSELPNRAKDSSCVYSCCHCSHHYGKSSYHPCRHGSPHCNGCSRQAFHNVRLELAKFKNRSAMISHFHRDHINGFIELTDPNHHPISFDVVYIPHIFTMGEHPNMLDFLLMRYFLEERKTHPTFSLWDMLINMVKTSTRIKLVKRESHAFSTFGYDHDVLWPVPTRVNLSLVDLSCFKPAAEFLSSGEHSQSIYTLSDKISEFVVNYENSNGNISWGTVDFITEQLAKAPFYPTFSDNELNKLAKSLRRANLDNEYSIVCQMRGAKKLLLTGDIRKRTGKKILLNKFETSIPLFDHFYAVKAPHHGTNSHYLNFGCYTVFDHLLISNGEPDSSKRGQISMNYNLKSRNYAIHCTNTLDKRCECISNGLSSCSGKNDHCNINLKLDIIQL